MIPESIKAYQPKCTEVRLFNGAYYVYKITSVWDSEKQHPKKKTLGCIGKITESEGFIPSKKNVCAPVGKVVVKEYGCSKLFEALNRDLYVKLKEYFNTLYREIFAISMIRLMNKTTNATIKRYYNASYLSEEFRDLRLSENTITAFMKDLGERRPQMCGFMQEFIPKGETLLFDGTCLFSDSKESSFARQGYNPRAKKNGQINLLYAFDRASRSPVYYRLLPGNIVDKTAFANTLKEAGITDCIVIADKGFYSKSNTAYLDENRISYILPLRDDTKYVNDSFLAEPERNKYDGCFIYHDRVVWYKKQTIGGEGKFIYIFQDDGLKNSSELIYLRKKDAGYDDYSLEDFFVRQKHFGMHFLYSNLDSEPEEIYLSYKARWEIEECFDYLKNGIDLGTVYQRGNEKIEAWAFLNHISLMMFYSLYKKLSDVKLIKKHCPEEIIGLAKNIYRVKINDSWFTSEVSKTDLELFKTLGVDLYT